MEKELGRLEEGPKAKRHFDSLWATLKMYKIGKRQTMMAYIDWFKIFTSIHDRLTIEMNKHFEETDMPEWMTKGKTTQIQKDRPKGTALITIDP